MKPYFIVLIVAGAVLVLLFALASAVFYFAFGKRCDKNKNLKYFNAEDFGLSAEQVSLGKGLKGFLYLKPVPQKDKIIVFCHGMGPGHIAYTTEIACLCSLGYPVLAVDSAGCNFSDGKNIKGMYSGVRTAVAAVEFLKKKNLYGSIWLVGHSWGAYSALCASSERKVDGVVAISSPLTPSKTLQDAAARVISKPIAFILRPFWWMINLFAFGVKGNRNAAKCAMNNSSPTLLIHGTADRVVNLSGSAFDKAHGRHIKKLVAEGKAHNPYNTLNAEKLLAQLSYKLSKGEKDFSDFDFKGATEEDEDIMRAIDEFISEN